VLLRWLITQLRPDAEPTFERIPSDAWLKLTSWRPMLAVACHAGAVRVPEFRERYRRRQDEAILENLCGLWNVGPSTFYRYQERGKRTMAHIALEWPLAATRRLSLRQFVVSELRAQPGLATDEERHTWHRQQIERAAARRDPCAGCGMHGKAATRRAFAATLRTHATALADEPETDALTARHGSHAVVTAPAVRSLVGARRAGTRAQRAGT